MESNFPAGTAAAGGFSSEVQRRGWLCLQVPSVPWVGAEKPPDCPRPAGVGPGSVLQPSPCLHTPPSGPQVAQSPPPCPRQTGHSPSKAASLPILCLLSFEPGHSGHRNASPDSQDPPLSRESGPAALWDFPLTPTPTPTPMLLLPGALSCSWRLKWARGSRFSTASRSQLQRPDLWSHPFSFPREKNQVPANAHGRWSLIETRPYFLPLPPRLLFISGMG